MQRMNFLTKRAVLLSARFAETSLVKYTRHIMCSLQGAIRSVDWQIAEE